MRLGLQLGYWGAQPPDGVGALVAAAEDAGFDALFTAEAWGSDAFTPLGLVGARDQPAAARDVDRADVRADAGVDRDARAHSRPPLRRSGDPRHGGLRAAGSGGLVRPAVREAVGPHPRGGRHRAPGARAGGAGDQRRPALPAAVRR